MNRKHRKFDLGMELLCLLPHYPKWADSSQLVFDLELQNQWQLHDILAVLKKKKYTVITRNNQRTGHRQVCVAFDGRVGSEKTKCAAREYWATVYTGNQKRKKKANRKGI